ncbi:MAG: hypothetical protein K0R38_6955 [Polyangiaceae bacterium]|jgi:hypothetical protein|nr:hypothetical protein [Polyangiaceae bacterium]
MKFICGAAAVAYLGLGGVALNACGSDARPAPTPMEGTALPNGGRGSGDGGAGAGQATSAGANVGGNGVVGGAGVAPSGGQAASAGAGGGGAGGTGGSVTGGAPPTEEATFIPDPSWTCGRPGGIVAPVRGRLVLSAELRLGEAHDVGATPFGKRRVQDVTGGSFEGDNLKGTVLTGGLELELELSNGSAELEQLHVLRTDDGTLIYLRSCGVAPVAEQTVRIVPRFEVSKTSGLAWLSDADLVGTRRIDEATGTAKLEIYDVENVAVMDPKVTLRDPAGEPQQRWDCTVAQGSQGATVFTETVTLGASLSVGQGNEGSRNIIPITGGKVTGRIQGEVLPGGADYQLVGGSTQLDARYTLAASDGELILVRNCGAFGALVPVFEARAAGPYSFLNQGAFLSSDPGSASGGVSITVYERK